MSHLFGYIKPSAFYGEPKLPMGIGKTLVETPSFILYSSGISETTFYDVDQVSNKGFAVVGVGLRKEQGIVKHLTQKDWMETCSRTVFDVDDIEGHYLVITWNEKKIEFRNDFLGLRTAYLYTGEDRVVYFSTRLDWLSEVIPDPEIDFTNYGAHWILINQINNGSFLKKVKRLGPSSHTTYNKGEILVTEKLFKPSWNSYSEEEFQNQLRAFSNPVSEYDLTLGLSGGLDSRTVLSAIEEENSVESYSFGNQRNPDVYVAQRAASKGGFEHTFYEEKVPLFKDSEAEILDYTGQLQGVSLLHEFYRSNVLKELNGRRKLMIDGGFGEIHRRQFLGRLAFMNSKKPSEIGTEELFNALSDSKFNFFARDITDQMIEGSKVQIGEVWAKASSNSDSTLGNSIDLFSLYSRISNISAMDHSWSDSLIPAYMPFVQKSLLETMFGISPKRRSNAKLFKKFISNHNPGLSTIPLVKSGLTYPFALGKYSSLGFTKIKAKIITPFQDTFGSEFLLVNRDYVLDIMNSKSVIECELYNYRSVKDTIEAFYNGRRELEVSVNQWLSFELWRRTIGF